LSKSSVKNVSVVGLGKLGLTLAAVLADSGYNVRGIELDAAKVDAINQGKSPIYETGLDDVIKKDAGRLSASTKFKGNIAETDATFVVVPTPSEDSGAFSTELVKKAMESVGKELNGKKQWHLVVLTSTVGPGSMDKVVKPALERSSGKRVGVDLGLCYNPEFIALGDVIRGLREPDFILIGESDKKAGDVLESIQRVVCTNSPPMERMEFINAELAKISVNSFVTMKMSFANTLAEISEKMPGGNVDKITAAVGRDKRIGSAYLKGATGFGGACFPRDNVAFAHYANELGAQALIAQATDSVNRSQTKRLLSLLKAKGLAGKAKVGILGLSFKPNTNVVEQSQSLFLAQNLAKLGRDVTVYDPASMDNAKFTLKDSVSYAGSAEELVRKSDVIVLATPWPEFAKLTPGLFKGKAVLDCWRLFGKEIRSISRYSAIGFG
jgi:UDPglucose 6-dehydrogenase